MLNATVTCGQEKSSPIQGPGIWLESYLFCNAAQWCWGTEDWGWWLHRDRLGFFTNDTRRGLSEIWGLPQRLQFWKGNEVLKPQGLGVPCFRRNLHGSNWLNFRWVIRTITNFLGQSGEATRQLAAFQEAVAVVTKCHPRPCQPFMMVGLGDDRTGEGVEWSKKHWVSMHVYQ